MRVIAFSPSPNAPSSTGRCDAIEPGGERSGTPGFPKQNRPAPDKGRRKRYFNQLYSARFAWISISTATSSAIIETVSVLLLKTRPN